LMQGRKFIYNKIFLTIMALSQTVTIILVIIINIVLFYIAAAIMSVSMFRREAKRWTWLNLIMAGLCTVAWVFGAEFLIVTGSATSIMFGIVIFFLCWIVWVVPFISWQMPLFSTRTNQALKRGTHPSCALP